MKLRSIKNHCRGFTLIETLISTALLGMSALVLSQSFYHSAKRDIERDVREKTYTLKKDIESALTIGCRDAIGGQGPTGDTVLHFGNARFQGMPVYSHNLNNGSQFGDFILNSVNMSTTPVGLDGGAFSNTLTIETTSLRAPWIPAISNSIDIVYWINPGPNLIADCSPENTPGASCLRMGAPPGCTSASNLTAIIPSYFCIQAGLSTDLCNFNGPGIAQANTWLKTLITANGGNTL